MKVGADQGLARVVDRGESIESRLTVFFEGLRSGVACVQELRKGYDKKLAFDFNSLNFFYPGENKTSEILAFFLNPNSPHGQGDVFLKCFCLNFVSALVINDHSTAEVRTEYPTDQKRRIDIVIKFPQHSFFIGIENKIWAVDQHDQLGHYSRFLDRESNGNYHLIYLSPYGKDPSDVSISPEEFERLSVEGKLSILSYQQDIVLLFDNFIQVCMAENVQAFLKDFQKHLKQRYRGEKEMSEDIYIRKFIAKKENVSLALGVARQIDVVKDELWKETTKQLEKWGSGKGYNIDIKTERCSGNSSANTDLLAIADVNALGWQLLFTFQGRNFSKLLVIVESTNPCVNYPLLQKANVSLGFAVAHEENVNLHTFFTPYEGSWSVDARPWDAMNDQVGENNLFVNAIIAEYNRVKEVMDSLLPTNTIDDDAGLSGKI